MEKRDYLLREIQKIGILMSALRQKLLGGKGNLAVTSENQIEETKEMLFNDLNFDLDAFLSLNIEDGNEYICSFKGFNIENMESFAKFLSDIACSDNCDNSNKYLEKALQLYELCNFKSDTYSFEREMEINYLKNAIKSP
ncbi:MAG: hypothetical protein FWH59_00525 [Lentimicrobiaceae bacterium]|nr:hypothetical protein [Lentimicrobiaceae bacterium]